MRATESGVFVAGRGYSFKDEDTGKLVQGGNVWIAHGEADGDNEIGARLEHYSCSAPVFDAFFQAQPEFGMAVEVDAELRPGQKKPRILALRRASNG